MTSDDTALVKVIEGQPDRAVRAGWLTGYGFIDYATQGYVLVVALLVLFFHGHSVPYWRWLLLAHGGALLLVHGLIRIHERHPSVRWLDWLRHFYPVLFFTGFYRETGELNRMFVAGYLDPFFIRWEQAWFGCQPSLALMEALPFRAASELFYGAYFSYYLMIVGVGLALYIRNREQFLHYLAVLCFLFYACYLCYIVVPVVGPRIFSGACEPYQLPSDVAPVQPPVFPATVQAGLFFQVMAFIYRVFETPGAAFPSSHVIVAIGTACFSSLYLKRLRLWHWLAVFLLCVSTVYCRYHYVVDVLAGILAAVVLIPIGNWLYFRFRRSG